MKRYRTISTVVVFEFKGGGVYRSRRLEQNTNGEYYFDFDPMTIDWDDYFYKVHIPGVLKYLA
jgi:fatty acyl-CoA reductase